MKRIYIAWMLVFLCLLTALGVALLSIYAPPPTAQDAQTLRGIAAFAGIVGGCGAFFLVLDALAGW